ncbi:MAG: SRPBCC family protein [Gemmatimonadales bacterium]
MTDDTSRITETHREVGRRRIAAGEARTALLRRRYDAPIEDVWEACTDPERLNRWFLPVTGDLRVGGTFTLAGNASGEILRCEPPRLLTVTWVYGDWPVDEVELRLVPGEADDTMLELEHASVSGPVEWEGQMLDVIPGVGVGWELPLTYALTKYLRGELPDAPAAEWYEPGPEDEEFANRIGQAWAALVAAADTASHTETTSARERPSAS